MIACGYSSMPWTTEYGARASDRLFLLLGILYLLFVCQPDVSFFAELSPTAAESSYGADSFLITNWTNPSLSQNLGQEAPNVLVVAHTTPKME